MPVDAEGIVEGIRAAEASGLKVLVFVVPVDPESLALAPMTIEAIESHCHDALAHMMNSCLQGTVQMQSKDGRVGELVGGDVEEGEKMAFVPKSVWHTLTRPSGREFRPEDPGAVWLRFDLKEWEAIKK